MHTSPAGMTYQWYYHLVQYVRVYVPCGTMVPPVLYHGTYGRLPWSYSTMAIHQLPVATVQAALLEVQAGAFSGGEAREHGCETANLLRILWAAAAAAAAAGCTALQSVQ